MPPARLACRAPCCRGAPVGRRPVPDCIAFQILLSSARDAGFPF
ncbi:Uncharacterized protein ChrSV_1630 [Chromobacterium vaccinii]|nr:Uncharacterized protein ChrSW_1630 [Chromobacterium vaccinii]QND89088.1 Uncharacterized protein ChrSV_1630 [Chromobacterium vaccinii]